MNEIETRRRLRIGILGTRGIPNAYGGFEQCAQYLAEGLSEKGHHVWVYCSEHHPYQENKWKGTHLVHCKDPENKWGTAGQFLYDYHCITDARKRSFDILLQLGYTSNAIWFFRWPDTINVVNMDGLEWMRSKYNYPTQRFLKWSEGLAARHADAMVADSMGIRDYLLQRYALEATYIPYGARIPANCDASILREWALEEKNYHLLIARMEPENHVEEIIRAWMDSGMRKKLVVVGNTSNAYGRKLLTTYGECGVQFTEGIYEERKLDALRKYCQLYFHGHSVGGTNPSLLEAMASGCAVIAHDNPFNRSVLENDADYFLDATELAILIRQYHNKPFPVAYQNNNLEKIRERYSWNAVVNAYEELFEKLMGNPNHHVASRTESSRLS